MADRTVKVSLTAQVQGYIDGMEKAAQATRETGSETEKLAQQQAAFEQMGRASMVAGGAIAAGLALSTKAAIDWDSAWAGVTKTVDGSPEQLAAVEAGLRELSSVLPASHTEIAAVAEAAGQLGIATPEVVKFTRTMIDLGETTNLSSEEAATSLARFMTVMGTSQDQVSRLGSALVDLGNNYATTEAEIMAMSMRLSGAGAQIGMSEGQVLGLSTALSSVGIEAEAGGSAMSKVMIDIASSVDKGGDRVQQFAQVAGMSADQFSEKWKTAPGEALAAFVKGLADAEAQGKSTFGILEELGISEVRMRDALLRSASAADQFAAAMAKGDEAIASNTALTEEAEKRYETTAAKLQIMGNRVVDAAISLGEHLLPAVEGVAEGVGGFADMLSGLDGPMGAVVAWGGLITAGILLTGGAAMAAVPKIAAYKVAMETLGITGSAVRGKLGGIVSFLGGPWGLALGIATVATVGFNRAMDESKVSAQEMEIALKQGKNGFEAMQAEAQKGLNIAWVYDLSSSVENLGSVLEESSGYANNFTRFLFENFDDRAAIENVEELGRALATTAATDLPLATGRFKEFTDAAKLNRDQMALAIERMPEFKSALLDVAESAGLAKDDSTLLKIALGEIEPAAKDAADGADAGADALDELHDIAAQTQEAISALADEIRGFGSATFDTRDANRQLEASFQSLSDQLAENGLNFDISTEAGRANEQALDDVARATNVAAAEVLAATGSQEQMNAKLEEGKQKLIDILTPYYGSRDAAAAYVDELDLISPQKVTDIIANTDTAMNAVQTYKNLLDTIGGSIMTSFDTIINAVGGSNENGGIYAYENGGFATGIYKGGTPIHKFAEPQTIWEAYISGKPSERDRNRQIWAETGSRLGMNPAGSSTPPVVYVQNPWGEGYLRGKVTEVADARIDVSIQQQAQANRRAGL